MTEILQLAVVGMGLILFVMVFVSLVWQKITEGIGLLWFLLGGVLILTGTAPGLNAWIHVVPKEAAPALLLIAAVLITALFYISSLVSQLLRKNQELAMHVSLLNQENESMLYELRELREYQKDENTVCR